MDIRCYYPAILVTVQKARETNTNINLLLTEREGRTGEYWPEVVAVRVERMQRGPYPKQPRANIPHYVPEQVKLVSSLLYKIILKDVHYRSKILAEESRYTVSLMHVRVALFTWKALNEAMANVKLDKNVIVSFRFTVADDNRLLLVLQTSFFFSPRGFLVRNVLFC